MVALIQFILYLYVFVVGIVIGSFLTVVIYRVPLAISLKPRASSFCPNCQAPIKGYHNIPVFSYLWLRQMRRLRPAHSIRYPLVELFTGLLALLILAVYGFSFQWLVVFSAGAILILHHDDRF